MATTQRQENLIQIVENYEATHEAPYLMPDVILWAVERGDLDEPTTDVLREKWRREEADALSDAVGRKHHRDADGERVRSYYCVKVETVEAGKKVQRSFWASRERASFEFKSKGIHQRFTQITGDVSALAADVRSLNKFDRPKGVAPIQLNFDFTDAARKPQKQNAG